MGQVRKITLICLSRATYLSRTAALSTFIGVAWNDLTGKKPEAVDIQMHLDAACAWLIRAHDATADDGVSYGYSIKGRWQPSYRETSGYIAVTLFNLANEYQDADLRSRALKVSDWLVGIQNPDGSIANPAYAPDEGIVFDTGQVLFGYLRAHTETGETGYLDAAIRAGEWLTKRVDRDGAWRRNTHNHCPHTYNSRTAWALAQLALRTDNPTFLEAVRANLDWVARQEQNGWFDNCAFKTGLDPFTHTIAYAIRGLFEAGELLEEPAYQNVARRAADAVLAFAGEDGFIPGQFSATGAPRANYCCLTGNCQLAIIWIKLYIKSGDDKYLNGARRALGYVMRLQYRDTGNMDIDGAIKGSHPIWERYAPLSYPNWATKFFIDALLLLIRHEK